MTRDAQAVGDGILCCHVGDERFAFRGRDVRHVERAEYLRRDRGDDGRVGMLKLGGRQVPVFALGEVLGRTKARDHHAGWRDGHVAITADRNVLTGWLVDRIERTAQPAASTVAALPPVVGARAASWFEGIVSFAADTSALLLAPNHLMTPPPAAGIAIPDAAFTHRDTTGRAEPEPVAIVFSTTALPSCGARRYALSAQQVAAIVQPAPAIAVPGCHDFIAGVTWWHQAIVPVIDFRAPSERATHRRQMIAQCGRRHGSLVAVPIDADVSMCRPAAEHRSRPEAPCPPFASGVFDVEGESVALLDLDALLARSSES